MLSAVFCWAIYSLLGRKYMKEYDISPLMITAYTFGICMFACIPLMLWEEPAVYLPNTTLAGWLSILYISIFASIIGYLIHMTSVQCIGAARTSNFVNLVPVFAIIQAILIFGEAITAIKLLGAAVIIIAVYLSTNSPAVQGKV